MDRHQQKDQEHRHSGEDVDDWVMQIVVQAVDMSIRSHFVVPDTSCVVGGAD